MPVYVPPPTPDEIANVLGDDAMDEATPGLVHAMVGAMLLADFAVMRDGLLTVVGGGLTDVMYAGSVGALGRDLVVFVVVEGAGSYELAVGVAGPDGAVLLEGLVGRFDSDKAGVIPHVVPLREVMLGGVGVHTISVALNGTWVANVTLNVSDGKTAGGAEPD